MYSSGYSSGGGREDSNTIVYEVTVVIIDSFEHFSFRLQIIFGISCFVLAASLVMRLSMPSSSASGSGTLTVLWVGE